MIEVKPGSYVWKSKDRDFPVSVVSSLGQGPDGRIYVKIADSNTAVPFDELIELKEEIFPDNSRRPHPRRLF